MNGLNDIIETLAKLKTAQAECISDAQRLEAESKEAQKQSDAKLAESSVNDELIVMLEGFVAGASEMVRDNETFLRELYNADDMQRQSIIERRGGELGIDFESTTAEEMAEEDA